MKSTLFKIFLVVLLGACSQLSFAQCNSTIVLKSSKTNYIDAEGNTERSRDEAASIEISKTTVAIDTDNDHKMSGTITATTCDWKTPFKDGKTVIKATFEDPNGEKQHSTITIIGVAGKVTLTYQSEERPGVKIQVVADKFEEKKA